MNILTNHKAIALIVLLFVAGCSTVGAQFQPALPPNTDSSLVYIYRPSSWKNMLISPGVMIDGEEKFLIQNNGYSFFYLNPGVHTFTLKLSDRWKGLAQAQVDIEATRTYYLRVDTDVDHHLPLFVRNFRIVRVADHIGREEIKECGYLDPEKSKKFSKSYLLEDN